ncbi:hypothetical protein [Stagnihabitans tardus]|uniref:HEPN domain-containing protein n=1 Tax=Stagnihabitans tardus TaxID=2699202 RepID=A0AAE4YEC6_9RHOB|nr:hypothetical protein [Stagnihabitans tardus]NBZ89801.1 hypothetical protein [Stagnihabitans tardus]
MQIPDDISVILREIDQSLREKAVPPHSRPVMAVIEFGKQFRISLPLAKLPPGAPAELVATSSYTDRIQRWYEDVYGDLIKVDFSEKAKVAVLADGDIWELRVPLFYGTVVIEVSRNWPIQTQNMIGAKVLHIDACTSLVGITDARLQHFSEGDLNEVYGLFAIGLDVQRAFDRFRKADPMFAAAEDDWAAAVANMIRQSPNWGHARWASLQMTEKFLKGQIKLVGDVPFKRDHDLMGLHEALARSAPGLNLKHLLADIQCGAGVRYNDPKTPSTRQQAYAAHKASLLVVRVLGEAKYG